MYYITEYIVIKSMSVDAQTQFKLFKLRHSCEGPLRKD